MNNIFDEAIEVLESSKSITGFSCDYPEAIKAIKLGKLYKELAEIRNEQIGIAINKNKLSFIDRGCLIGQDVEIVKEIEAIENE